MADCIVTIIGKNGKLGSYTLPNLSNNSLISEIISKLSETDLSTIQEKLDTKGSTYLIDLNSTSDEYATNVIGNYTGQSLEQEIKKQHQGFKGFSDLTNSLLQAVEASSGNTNFILLSNLDYSSNKTASSINGAVLRYNEDRPLLLIKGEDPLAIENTLRHELTHLLFNKIIDEDQDLKDSIEELHSAISRDVKKNNPKTKSFENVFNTIETLSSGQNFHKEAFAYYFQDINSYEYIKEKYPKLFERFNNILELRSPTSPITVSIPGSENIKYAGKPEFNKLPAYKGNTMTYAGIGSRETPPEVLKKMSEIAYILQSKGYTLNSGGAQGADLAFENGITTEKKNIFYADDATDLTRNIAKEIHPNPKALKGVGLNLMARNTFQIFGGDLNTPVDFVLAYTPDNLTDYRKRTRKSGGTGQAIEMASRKGIPVINMADPNWEKLLDNVLRRRELRNNDNEIFNTYRKVKKPGVVFTKEQQEVIDNTIDFVKNGDSSEFFVISGKAGTGKTTVAEAIAKAFPDERVVIGAVSHQATTVIEEKFKLADVYNADAYTLASMLGLRLNEKTGEFEPAKDERFLPIKKASIIIVDEASMISELLLEQIMQYKQGDAKVVFLGDIGQLRPIRTGLYYRGKSNLNNKKGPVFEQVKGGNIAKLHTRIRQGEDSPILPFADYYWNASQGITQTEETKKLHSKRENKITDKGGLIFINTVNSIKELMMDLFKDGILNNNPNKVRYITYTNDVRERLNKEIRKSIFGDDVPQFVKKDLITFTNNLMSGNMVEISNSTDAQIIDDPKITEISLQFPSGDKKFKAWDLRIDIGGEEKNILVLHPSSESSYTLLLEAYREHLNTVGWRGYGDYLKVKNRFAEIDYGYAITSHKSQGSTYDVAIIDESNIYGVQGPSEDVKAESTYTALTRPRNVAVVISNSTVKGQQTPNIIDLNKTIEDNKKSSTPTVVTEPTLSSELTIFNDVDPKAISFLVEESVQDVDKMMPHLQWDSEKKTFSNINDAYEFLDSFKNDEIGLANVWSQPQEISNISQIANAKSGDILRMSSLEYLPIPKDGEVGLFGPTEWYGKMIPREDMLRRITENLSDLDAYREKLEQEIKNKNKSTKEAKYKIPTLTDAVFNKIIDKQISVKSKYYKYDKRSKTFGELTEEGKKYLNIYPNYILARVFYDSKNNIYKGYVAHKFKNKEDASCMLIDLDPQYIRSIRRMDDSFRQEYEYKDGELVTDSKGNPKTKLKSSKYDVSKIPEKYKEAAKAGLINLSKVIPELETSITSDTAAESLLTTHTFKNGNSIYKATEHGIMITGFFGTLGDALQEASPGDYIKVIKKRTGRGKGSTVEMEWCTKVSDLPGGILVLTAENKLRVVTDSITSAVVFAKDSLSAYLDEVENIVDETSQLTRQQKVFSSQNKNKDFSIYPFWNTSEEDKRKEMAKTLKKGDYIKLMFRGKDRKPVEFVAPILFNTGEKIFYGTKGGGIQSVDIKSYTEGEWVKKNNEWIFSGIDNIKNTFIRAAYVDHRAHKDVLEYFTQYITNANELRTLPWQKETKEYVSLDNITELLVGSINNPQNRLQKASISSEWAITEFQDSDINTKVRKLSNLIVGDLVKIEYDYTKGSSQEKRYKWGMVVGKDARTNEPITAVYGKDGKVIVRKQSYENIHSVGERTLPIYLNKETGEYSNYEQLDYLLISEGRPDNLQRLKSKYSEFFENGLKLVTVSENELSNLEDKLNRNFGKRWESVELVRVSDEDGVLMWVQKFDPSKHTKVETDEKMYRILGRTSTNKSYPLRQYQIQDTYAKLYNTYKASFDDINGVVLLGDLLTYEVTTSKGDKMYIPGIVTEVTNSAIEISAVRVDYSNGEKLYSSDTYTWFKNSKNDNIKVNEFYGSQYNKVYDLGKSLKDSGNGKKSLETPKYKKSYDNRETVLVVSERLNSLYGVNTILLTNQEMIEKGREFNSNFENVRGFALSSKNEIYINIDKASIAEPLHELSHILLPGLRAKNPKVFNLMMDKIKEHPSYSDIAESYPELVGRDLDEEVFVTIFAEYFREKTLTEEKNNWLSEEFLELAENIPSITSSIFDNDVDSDVHSLMNMTIEEIMDNFGSDMIYGKLSHLIPVSINLNGNSDVRKIYKNLIDRGKLKKLC